jgi:hypothetical protein
MKDHTNSNLLDRGLLISLGFGRLLPTADEDPRTMRTRCCRGNHLDGLGDLHIYGYDLWCADFRGGAALKWRFGERSKEASLTRRRELRLVITKEVSWQDTSHKNI